MAVNNNLYPPIVATYMPAFLINSGDIVKDTCRVYFSISSYNSLSDFKNAQITVADQNTNRTVLSESKYPCGIMLTPLYEDLTKESDDRFYIDIKKTDLIGGNFEINKYYKVQIRFTGTAAEDVSFGTPQAIDSWLAANQSTFSEWSTVCLIRGISAPKLSIKGIDASAEYAVWTSANVDVVGKLTFANENETERLKNYRLKLYQNEELVCDSDLIYANIYSDVNEINYTFKYMLEDGGSYRLEITYETNDLYTESVSYNLIIIQGGSAALDAKLYSNVDDENGRISLYIRGNTTDLFTGNIMIRRTSSESNFTVWEDIHLIKANQQMLEFTWYDNTVKSGVWYNYCIQEISGIGQRSVIVKLKRPVMIELDHIYIVGKEKQLKVKFNPNVSSYQRTISESKTDTIGSKYPYVKRNGNMNYRQFGLSGTISHFMDQDGLLISRNEMYPSKEILDMYDANNNLNENQISPYKDFTYERDFREKVMDFLYDNEVKLYRSATEGNLLVKLMNISLTPNQTLGRMIYDFSCTVIEIDEDSIDNYKKYGIQTIEEYMNQYFSYSHDIIGQYERATIPANKNVLELIAEEQQKTTPEGFIAKTESLTYLRLEMPGKPQAIKEGASGPYIYNADATTLMFSDRSAEDIKDVYTGYLVYINDMPIVVPPEGIYELKGSNVNIVSLIFPIEMNGLSINYNAKITQAQDKTTVHTSETFYSRMGQWIGVFTYEDSLYKELWSKYYAKYSSFSQSLVSINEINIEADPGIVVYIKEGNEDSFDRHVIGSTARLNLADPEEIIEGIYFAGRHLVKANEAEADRELCPEDRFIETGITVDTVDEITNPIVNGVYTINGSVETGIMKFLKHDIFNEYDKTLAQKYDSKFAKQMNEKLSNSNRYIYYNYAWYNITDDNDVICAVPAMIDYCYDLMKGLYA